MTCSPPLWSFEALVEAAAGIPSHASAQPVTGVSIDTRTLMPGDLFVALKDQRDGHDFVRAAFAKGAAAALVSDTYVAADGDGALIRVADPLRALEAIGRAARARLSPEARVIAVTGSVGKTTTKEMLRLAFSAIGRTHASEKSYNNHWGVPLTLARMPADTRYAVFEIGMNHAGEITPLTCMVRPHVALVTVVANAHIENFPNEEGIADAKAEIFLGLGPDGTAIINLDNRHAARLIAAARARRVHVSGVTKDLNATEALATYGVDDVVALASHRMTATSSEGEAVRAGGRGRIPFEIGTVGMHMLMNALFVTGALDAAGADTPHGLAALTAFAPPPGRGSRTRLSTHGGEILIIDESYNANPASMRAALSVLPALPRTSYPRRIAVLGDMLELGADGPALHAGLCDAVDDAEVDLVFAAGPQMAALFDRLPPERRGAWASSAADLEKAVLNALAPGDVVMVKGSNGSKMGPLVAAILEKFSHAGPAETRPPD
jgi:UDP-N-acetylmuramoyl-tripeptide--D-alanyl-D-alanine ligase